MLLNCIQFRKRKNHIIIFAIMISICIALSSCVNKRPDESNPSQGTESPYLTVEPITSANNVDDQADGSYVVVKDKLDTTRPYIKIYNVYGVETYVQLDSDTVDEISKELNTMEKTDLSEYIGIANDYFPENIYFYIGNKLNGVQTDFGSGYSVLRNSENKTCLRDSDKGIDYNADNICKLLISIAKELQVIPNITKDDISTITKAELTVDNLEQVEITDKKTLEKIENIFKNSERIVNPGTYNITSILTLTSADGKTIDIELDDASDICIIGHTYWYDYGPGTDGDNSRNANKELFELLGITAYPEIHNWYNDKNMAR